MMPRMVPVLAGLLGAALLWPAEDADRGTGLPRVLILAAAVLTVLIQTVRTVPGRQPTAAFRWQFADLAVVMLAVGHWVSAAAVLADGGNGRAALNLSFEWMGLLLFWFCLRAVFVHAASRAVCLAVMTSFAAGLASYGIWQHGGFYAEQSAWYQELRQEFDELQGHNDPESAWRAAQIRSELESRSAWFEGNDRARFEQRLLHSSEALGVFGLANTLAGVLAVALVVLVLQLVTLQRTSGPRQLLPDLVTAAAAVIILYCLILTKSRSAWLGTAAAFGVAGWDLIRGRMRHHAGRWLFVGTGGLLVLIAIAVGTGALDREVLLETPRSVQYRVQYWSGTAGLMAESPLLGAGPGNFRSAYLRHKLPESSEEIQDPHNLVLDAWASGGLLSLVGVISLLAAVALRRFRQPAPAFEPAEAACAVPGLGRTSLAALATAMVVHSSIQWIGGDALDVMDLHWLLIPGVAVLCAVPLTRAAVRFRGSLFPAIVAIVVHLLAAGSLQFPAVTLLLLVCACGAVTPVGNPGVTGRLTAGRRTRLAAVGGLSLGIGLLTVWGILPVWKSEQFLMSAVYARSTGNSAQAEDQLLSAADADPLDPIPRQQLAEFRAYRLLPLLMVARASAGDSGLDQIHRADVVNAVDEFEAACDMWLQADQRAVGPWRLRAAWLDEAGGVVNQPDWQERAVGYQLTVVQLYPTSAPDWLRLARMLADRPDGEFPVSVTDAAQQALKLDRINRDWGHTDRYLSNADVEWLTAAASGTHNRGAVEGNLPSATQPGPEDNRDRSCSEP